MFNFLLVEGQRVVLSNFSSFVACPMLLQQSTALIYQYNAPKRDKSCIMTKINATLLMFRWFVMLGGTLLIFLQAIQVVCMTQGFFVGVAFIVGI
jgi:hypothetical protein